MSRVWRRWRAYRRRGARSGALVLGFVTIDLFTKWALVTPGFSPSQPGWHRADMRLMLWALMIMLPFAIIGIAFSPLGASLLTAGLSGNVLSALDDRWVPNPFQTPHLGGIAFNLADLYMQVGFVMIVAIVLSRLLGGVCDRVRDLASPV